MVFVFGFSAPLINYMMQDDWLASFVSYSLLPLLTYILIELITNKKKYSYVKIVFLSLFLFYYYYNGNPSFHIFLFFIFLLFYISSIIFKLKPSNFKNSLFIFIIVLVLIIPNIIHVFIELNNFSYKFANNSSNKYYAFHWFRLIDNLFPFVSLEKYRIEFIFFEKIFNFEYLNSLKILLT